MINGGIYTDTTWWSEISFKTATGEVVPMPGDYECLLVDIFTGQTVFTLSSIIGHIDLSEAQSAGKLKFLVTPAQHQPAVKAGLYRTSLKRVDGNDVWAAEGRMLVGNPGDRDTYFLFDVATDGSSLPIYPVDDAALNTAVLTLAPVSGTPLNALMPSAWTQVAIKRPTGGIGSAGANVSVSGTGTPQFRIADDATGTNATAWGTTTAVITDGKFVQIRTRSAAVGLTAASAVLTIGATSKTFTVTTASAPALLAAGLKAVTAGDSIIQYGNQGITTNLEVRNDGDSELSWALFRLGGHNIKHQIWYDATAIAANYVPTYAEASATDPLFRGANFGLAGDTTTGVSRRFTAILNSGAGLIIYNAGTNVGAGDAPVEVVQANITAAVNAAVAAGRKIIVGTIRPRRVAVSPVGSQITPALRDRALTINDWIRTTVPALGGAVWDPWEALRDPAYPIGDQLYGSDKPGVTRDNVHLTPLGAYLSSESLAAAISQIVNLGSWFNVDPTISSLHTNNQTWTGATGSASGGASGTLPTGVNVIGPGTGNVTVACSVEANSDTGGQTVIMDITSDGGGAANSTRVFNVSLTNPTTGFTGTDWLQGYAEIDLGAASVASLVPAWQLTLGQASTIIARGLGQTVSQTTYSGEPYPDEAVGRGWIATEPNRMGALTSLNLRFNFTVRADVAGTRRIKLRKMFARIVPSPVTEFPWSP